MHNTSSCHQTLKGHLYIVLQNIIIYELLSVSGIITCDRAKTQDSFGLSDIKMSFINCPSIYCYNYWITDCSLVVAEVVAFLTRFAIMIWIQQQQQKHWTSISCIVPLKSANFLVILQTKFLRLALKGKYICFYVIKH